MNTLVNLYDRLIQAESFQEKYPEYQLNDGKIHVLYLSPCLNETGYYRMILPSFELNGTTTHAAIVASIHKWDFNKGFDDYDNPVDFRLVKWADYIVLPAIFTDVEYIIKSIREINSDVDFVMDLDLNYHELPDYHPDHKRMTPELKNNLVKNLSRVDVLTAPNSIILNYYHDLVKNHSDEFLLCFERLPSLLSHYTYEQIPQLYQNSSSRIRIGIILDASQASDLRTIEKPLLALLEEHQLGIEVVLFGCTPKICEQHDLFPGVNLTYEKPVPFPDYHARLNSLALDIGLLPMVANAYNASGKIYNRFLDFSANIVPMVAAHTAPLDKLIKEGDNGFLAATDEEWVLKINQLIADAQLRKDMGHAAMQIAWEHFSYTPKVLQRLKTIFV